MRASAGCLTVWLFAFLAPGRALSQESRALSDPSTPLTFTGALSLAYQTNPRLRAERRQLAQTDEAVPQALAGWRPKVTITGSIGAALFDDNMDSTHDPERRAPQDYELKLSQNIYTSGQVRAQTQQAEAQVLAGRAELRNTEAEILLAAGSAYLDVVRDRRIVVLNANQVKVQQDTVQANAVNLAAGGVAAADLGQARARLGSARAQLASAEATLAQSEARFEREIGQPPGELLRSAPMDFVTLPASRARAVSVALENNPNVAASRSALDASRHGIDVERAGLLPHFSINGLFGRLRDTEIQKLNQRDNAAQVTLDVNVPIYQGGGEYSRIRQAKESADRLNDLLDDSRREARQLATSAWDAMEAARQRLADEHEAIAGNEIALRGYTQQQRAGERTLLDVLVVQQDLLASEVAEVSSEHDLMLARLQLASATGVLDAAHLSLAAEIYDPARHYDAVRDKWIGTTPPPP